LDHRLDGATTFADDDYPMSEYITAQVGERAQPIQCKTRAMHLTARTAAANVVAGTMRVTFWGVRAMAVRAGAGTLFGTLQ
jgi:hypothetical protein